MWDISLGGEVIVWLLAAACYLAMGIAAAATLNTEDDPLPWSWLVVIALTWPLTWVPLVILGAAIHWWKSRR